MAGTERQKIYTNIWPLINTKDTKHKTEKVANTNLPIIIIMKLIRRPSQEPNNTMSINYTQK